jgi:ABC-type glycerol-3-phosphate transport system permease component
MSGLDPAVDSIARDAPRAWARRALAAPNAASRPIPRLARYVVHHGWIHLLLLAGIGIFLFPFVYMFATSLKTDEELTSADWFPAIPHFQPNSPRVRPAPALHKPLEAPPEKWAAVLPALRRMTREAVDAAPLPVGGKQVDPGAYRAAASELLLARLVSRLNLDLWTGDSHAIEEAYQAGLSRGVIDDALNDRLARLELRGLQVRTLDGHVHAITAGSGFASGWTIESGDAAFIPSTDSTILRYHFDGSSDAPIVLSCKFDCPGTPQSFHKLIFSLKPDDSWHRVDATLDLGGTHWVSQKSKYLGTTRNQSILFQPPSFDDTTDRKRVWVPMKAEGTSRVFHQTSNPQPPTSNLQRQPTTPAVLHITISPSSAAGAWWGKFYRNYDRVFDSMPFWRYVRNSLLVVILATAGTAFSSAFVAYAFARLHWPGRTLAFALLLSTMMLPEQVTMIPSFMIWRSVGLYNTLCPLWIPAWFGVAFFIFLMVQYMRTIPRELEEAARIDGASPLRTWAQIIVPQCRPAMAAIAIMTFMGSWNEFMKPLIYLRDQSLFPLSLGLYALRLDAPEGGIDWTLIMAGNVLMTLPVILVFFLFQRYFIEGMTMSGMKG